MNMNTWNIFFQKHSQLVDIHKNESLVSTYADKWVELTLTHSMIVCKIAFQIAEKLEKDFSIYVDKSFLQQGILLHDVGVYSCFDEEFNPKSEKIYIQHGQIGYNLIKKYVGSEPLARIALTHTGFGGIDIDEIEANNLPLEKIDMYQITLEEEIISWADKFHTKWPRFYTSEEVEAQAAKFGIRNLQIFNFYKNKFGTPDLEELKEQYSIWHKEFDEFVHSISMNSNVD